MKLVLPSKRKLFELSLLPLFCLPFIILGNSPDIVILLGLGYIWNWAASNDLPYVQENRRYRMSLIGLVVTINDWILKPFHQMHPLVTHFVRLFPAGIFWLGVLFINDSVMPWWATFVGSLLFELTQIKFVLTNSPTKNTSDQGQACASDLPENEQ